MPADLVQHSVVDWQPALTEKNMQLSLCREKDMTKKINAIKIVNDFPHMCLYFNANTVSSHTNTHKRAGCTRLCKHLCVSDMGVDLYGLSAFPDVIRVTTGSIA